MVNASDVDEDFNCVLPVIQTALLEVPVDVAPAGLPPVHSVNDVLQGTTLSTKGTIVSLPGLGVTGRLQVVARAYSFHAQAADLSNAAAASVEVGVVGPGTSIVYTGGAYDVILPADITAACLEDFAPQLVEELLLRIRVMLGWMSSGDAGHVATFLQRRAPKSILLHGRAGSGKTQLVKGVGQMAKMAVVQVSAGRMVAMHGVDADSALEQAWQCARALSPAILLLDDVDFMLPSATKRNRAGAARLRASMTQGDTAVEQWVRRAQRVGLGSRVAVVMTAREAWTGLEGAVVVTVTPPIEQVRRGIMSRLLTQVDNEVVERACRKCQDMVLGELAWVTRRASALCAESCQWERALDTAIGEHKRRRISRSVTGVLKVEPPVTWTDVGGLRNAKQLVQEMLTWPLTHPEAFNRLGIAPPTGLLLYGPPGTGKTLMAKAAACEAGAGFLSLRISDIVRGEIGTSEVLLRDAFRTASKNAPCIIFIDEFRAFFTRRGGGNSSSGGRLASQLLQCMDELTVKNGMGSSGKVVTVIAATNSPDAVDSAFLRPGRFDRLVYAALPDEEERLEILQGLAVKTRLGPEVNLRELAVRTERYSGADLSNVLRQAGLHAVRREICGKLQSRSLPSVSIQLEDLEAALSKCCPSTLEETLRVFDAYQSMSKQRNFG